MGRTRMGMDGMAAHRMAWAGPQGQRYEGVHHKLIR
jgi:hypothetical protein